MKKTYPLISMCVIAVTTAIFLPGCDPVPEEAGSADNSASVTAQQTPAVQLVPITYKVSGTANGISGTYTDATGAEVPIPATVAASGSTPAYAPLPWQITIQVPIDIARRQQLTVKAKDAFGTGTVITTEIWSDANMLATHSGPEPSTSVTKH